MPLDANARLAIARSDPQMLSWVFGSGPTPEDSYLYTKLGGDFARYEEMLIDPQVRGKLSERVGALLGRSVLVDPAFKHSSDRRVSEVARNLIDTGVIPYEQICAGFLNSGLLIGFSVQAVVDTIEAEIYIKPEQDKEGAKPEKQTVILPVLEVVPQRRFVFRYHDPARTDVPIVGDQPADPETEIVVVGGYELRLLTTRASIDGERCPRDRFFIYTFGSIKGLPQGYGLGAMIRKFYEIRKECLRSGVLTADRLGSPPVHGTYPDTLDLKDPRQAEVIGAFSRLLKAISPSAHAATTEGFKINFLEPRSGGHVILKWLYDTSGMEITRAIWGEGSYAEKDTGSYAAEAAQSANRNENYVDSDCNSLDEQLNRQYWRWIWDRNYPKANAPIIRRETIAERRSYADKAAQEERRNSRVTTDRILINDIGLNVTNEYIRSVYGEDFSLNQAQPEADNEGFSESDAEFGANVHHYLTHSGLKIGVRHLPGETRFPQFRSARKLPCAYGFAVGYRQNGRSLRCYLNPKPEAGRLYAVSQLRPTGEPDEIKLMVGFGSIEQAELAYRRAMPESYFGGIKPIALSDLEPFSYSEGAEPDVLDKLEEKGVNALAQSIDVALAPLSRRLREIAKAPTSDAEKYRSFLDSLSGLDRENMAIALSEGLTASYLAGLYSERVEPERG